jgi:predicted MPP superfamily phosphohydrolase
MLSTIITIVIALTIYASMEYYGWQAIRTAFNPKDISIARYVYWSSSILLIALFLLYRPVLYKFMPRSVSTYFGVTFMIVMLSKIIVLLFLFPEDIVRLFRFAFSKISGNPPIVSGFTRSQFLSRVALAIAAIPAGTIVYGMIANAYNYQFKKISLRFPNLPAAFNGYKLVHLSDIHAGSFNQKEPIEKVIEKINALEADAILFTGDLVNNVASEMDEYISVFGKLKAKHGVFSITGNHDYGDYVEWDSEADKKENFKKFIGVHKSLGWDLLMNEHRVLEKDGEKIALLGIENWGTGRWTKYGKMDKAHAGTEQYSFKILMSHNPQHWDAQVRTEYPDVDITLSGHTHGGQFGVEEKWLKWSPVQYIYKQWTGLYQEGKQFIYVNPGFGFLFYPGRVGILPEITVITLEKA